MTGNRPVPVFDWGGRPCVQAGQKKKRHPKFGWFVLIQVRFLDGKLPAAAETTRGKFKAAKVVRGPQADIWRRVDQLIAQGMEPTRASHQAMAEHSKGVLMAGAGQPGR